MKAFVRPMVSNDADEPVVQIEFHPEDHWGIQSILAPVIKACVLKHAEHIAGAWEGSKNELERCKIVAQAMDIAMDDTSFDTVEKYDVIRAAMQIFAEDFQGYWT